MSNDSSSDLDSRIAAIVESTVGRMRDELMHRMQDTETRLRDITGRMGDEGPAAAPAPEPPPAAVAPAAGEAIAELFEGVVAMDRGRSQQEVLAALLEGVGRFASRAALFLTRSNGAQGWGSYGFEETAKEMQQVLLSYDEGPLARLAEGQGCVVLSADACAALARQMEVSAGAEGLLVPYVLRDRLAAALYVDRFADDPPLARQPLQLLAYVGAQAVEGLALRQRDETPTLLVAGEAAEALGVALWESPEAEAPAAPAEAAPPAPEPEPAEAAPVEPEAIAAPPAEMTLEEIPQEEPPAALVTEAPTAVSEAPTVEPEAEPSADWEIPAAPAEEPPAAPAEEPPAAPVEETPAAPSFEMPESLEQAAPPIEPPAEPAPEIEVEESQPWAETAGEGFSTVETEPPPPPQPEMTPPAGEVAPPAGGTTEVRPPTDVTGPGWAFTASRAAAEAGDDAQHEEARRLARLLVTEIKLYNEEQVEEGRRGNDIYARLKEDIDRSRQIFNERVDEAVRQETDYFHEEMVRILAGGNAEALGL